MKKIRILSLDGGGIRGIIPGVILSYLEKKLQTLDNSNLKIGDYFDFIAGSSTGGILACTYLLPSHTGVAKHSANEALDLYLKEGGDIFRSDVLNKVRSGFGLFDEKYGDDALNENLEEIFGDSLLSSFIKPCLITAYEITSRSAYFFNAANAKSDPIYDFKVKDIARSTSAAPTYFEPAKIHSESGQTFYFIDGGMFANNPTLCAYAEARKLKFSELLKREDKPDFPSAKDMLTISIGTGTIKKPYYFNELKTAGKLEWIQPVIDILMSGNSETVDYQLKQMYKTLSRNHKNDYYRLEPSLREALPDMDVATTVNLENLRQAGLWYVNKNKETLDEIASKILENK
ncbi:MAG: patatin-like phospholipase family protein [Aquaticitalea sp.]